MQRMQLYRSLFLKEDSLREMEHCRNVVSILVQTSKEMRLVTNNLITLISHRLKPGVHVRQLHQQGNNNTQTKYFQSCVHLRIDILYSTITMHTCTYKRCIDPPLTCSRASSSISLPLRQPGSAGRRDSLQWTTLAPPCPSISQPPRLAAG